MPNKYWAPVIEVFYNDGWDGMAIVGVGYPINNGCF